MAQATARTSRRVVSKLCFAILSVWDEYPKGFLASFFSSCISTHPTGFSHESVSHVELPLLKGRESLSRAIMFCCGVAKLSASSVDKILDCLGSPFSVWR